MTSRKDILKTFRAKFGLPGCNYSEPYNGGQRVKWYGTEPDKSTLPKMRRYMTTKYPGVKVSVAEDRYNSLTIKVPAEYPAV